MTIVRNPVLFKTGETLSPSRLNRGFQRIYRDAERSTDKRFNRFEFKMDFTSLTNASIPEEFVFRVKPPFGWSVEFVELFLFNATGTVTSVKLSAANLAGWLDVSVAPAGATTRARSTRAMLAFGAASSEVAFTLTVTATAGYTLGRCYANVHCVADRGSNTTYRRVTVNDAPVFASGEAVAAAKANTGFTGLENASTDNTAATKELRFLIFSLRQIAVALATTDRDVRIPDTGAIINSMDVVNLGAAGDNVTGHVMSAGRVDVTTAVANGSGAPPTKTQGTAVGNTQPNNTPTTPANDYFVQITRVGADIIPLAYVVVYFV